MKINGKQVTPRGVIDLILPRTCVDDPNAEPLVLLFQGVESYADFDAICPPPQAPGLFYVGKGYVPDLEDTNYLELKKLRAVQRWRYMVIKTLEPSNIEWDTVDINNPATWCNVKTELAKALGENDAGRVFIKVDEANGFSKEALDEARASFFQKRQAEKAARENPPSIPNGEAGNSKSGELAQE